MQPWLILGLIMDWVALIWLVAPLNIVMLLQQIINNSIDRKMDLVAGFSFWVSETRHPFCSHCWFCFRILQRLARSVRKCPSTVGFSFSRSQCSSYFPYCGLCQLARKMKALVYYVTPLRCIHSLTVTLRSERFPKANAWI
jgi:hypothetical protein